jgi:hypothetical protein
MVCPDGTATGVACSSKGMQCMGTSTSACATGPVQCTCDGTTFQCDDPTTCPPPVECPPPDTIVEGEPCEPLSDQVCQSSEGIACMCQGTWQCELEIDGGQPADAGAQ